MQDEWKLRENLRMTTGFRYDRYQLVGGLKEDLFSPRMGVNWQPWPTTSFRLSAGSGFRAATIIERYLELAIMNFKIIANPALKAESSWAYDFGFRQYINENWNVDISLFDNEYWELINHNMEGWSVSTGKAVKTSTYVLSPGRARTAINGTGTPR